MGLRRKYVGNDTVVLADHHDLIDLIRIRSKEDGIPFHKLDMMISVERPYFASAVRMRCKVNLRYVPKVVALFGGTLVINWLDRWERLVGRRRWRRRAFAAI